MRARLLYSKVIKLKLGWDVDVSKDNADICNLVKTLLHEILEVKSSLQPLLGAWVPSGNKLVNLIFPLDGEQVVCQK